MHGISDRRWFVGFFEGENQTGGFTGERFLPQRGFFASRRDTIRQLKKKYPSLKKIEKDQWDRDQFYIKR